MKTLLLILSILFFHLNLSANSFSIFSGSYDYDDDNTSTLYGLNYHFSDNEFSVFNLIDLNNYLIWD